MNYGRLEEVLTKAAEQASAGKGAERHADGQRFEDQPIMWIEREFKGFQLGQAVKKIHESQRLAPEAAARELLGAINYLAAKVIALDALADTVRGKAQEEVARAPHGQDLGVPNRRPARGSSVARGEAGASVEVTPDGKVTFTKLRGYEPCMVGRKGLPLPGAGGEPAASAEVTPGSPCADCHQQFGEYCLRACSFGKKVKPDAD